MQENTAYADYRLVRHFVLSQLWVAASEGSLSWVFLCSQIVLLLIPSEETDKSDLVMEVTPGVGGQEAMLFTSEIFDMYQRYAAYKQWKFEILEYFPSEIGQ